MLRRLPSRRFVRTGANCVRYFTPVPAPGPLHVPNKPSEFGQPTHESHPHLIAESDYVTPGIPAYEYERRRKALMDRLPEHSMVVSVAAPTKYMSGQIFYKYRQDSNFWYLTGFEEPNSAVILQKTSSSKGYRMTIFAQGKDSHREKWEGASTSLESVKDKFRSDDAQPISTFFAALKSKIPEADHVYVDLPPGVSSRRSGGFDFSNPMDKSKKILDFVTGNKQGGPKSEFDKLVKDLGSTKRKPLAPEVGKLRGVKSVYEQRIMRAAADVSARAHAKTMRFATMRMEAAAKSNGTEPQPAEAHLQAHFEYQCALHGSQRPAYVPVVASGANALIIHYVANDHLIQPDEMVLFDGGCEYKFREPSFVGYASDITRTYPANGTFTPAQRDLYAAILSAQKQVVALCTEASGLSLHDLHRKSVDLLRQELNQLGFSIVGGDLERLLYPHYLSHSIGIDLHESAHFDRMAPLKEGMVITIEPGIYVPLTPLFPKAFHNLGIRIEDQVLIGKQDPVVLSAAAPKEIADIEGACQGLLDFGAF